MNEVEDEEENKTNAHCWLCRKDVQGVAQCGEVGEPGPYGIVVEVDLVCPHCGSTLRSGEATLR